jgi:RNA recognition motif-containing protein
MPSVEEAIRAIEQPSEPRVAATPPVRLFVGGLSWETTAETLRRVWSDHGTVTDAVIIKDRSTGESRGFGFVTMDNRKGAARAIEALHDTELDGRRIVVKAATER